MNVSATLHKKLFGLPVWAVGGLGATGVILFHFLHSGGSGDAAPATTELGTGDPVPSDAGSFPQQYPYGTGSAPADGTTGYSGDLSSVGDAIGSLADLIASQPTPVDYSQQISDLSAAVGSINDQLDSDHSPNGEPATPHTMPKKIAPKLAKPLARGGQAKKVAAAKAPAKKTVSAKAPAKVTHPKAAPHKAPPPKPKPKPAPKPAPKKPAPKPAARNLRNR